MKIIKKILLILTISITNNFYSQMMNDKDPRKISKKELKELLRKFDGVIDKEYSNETGFDTFRLNSGQVIIGLENGKGVIYHSIEAIRDLVSSAYSEVKEKNNIIKGLSIDGQFFVNNIDSLSREFCDSIEISFPKKLKNLTELDKKINELGSEYFLKPEILLRLIAYISIILTNNLEGEVDFETAENGLIRPIIRLHDKSVLNFYQSIIVEIMESEKVDLRFIVEFKLDFFLIPPQSELILSKLNELIIDLEHKEPQSLDKVNTFDLGLDECINAGILTVDDYSKYVFITYNRHLYLIDNYNTTVSSSNIESLGESTSIFAYDFQGNIIWSIEQRYGIIEAITLYNKDCSKIEYKPTLEKIVFNKLDIGELSMEHLNKLTCLAEKHEYNYNRKIHTYFCKSEIHELLKALKTPY